MEKVLWDFLFEDKESGEQFFVECENMKECKKILSENDFEEGDLNFCGVFSVEEAEILGYDTY